MRVTRVVSWPHDRCWQSDVQTAAECPAGGPGATGAPDDGGGAPAPRPPPAPMMSAPPPPRRGGLGTALGAAALAVATIAMALAAMGFLRRPATDSAVTQSPTSASATTTTAADKALCEAVAPILADGDKVNNVYLAAGPAGSAGRDAALPKYVADIRDWVDRAQSILHENPDAQEFLRRSLQRFLDDNKLLALGLRPGRMQPYNEALYSDSMAAYNGPIALCEEVGVKW